MNLFFEKARRAARMGDSQLARHWVSRGNLSERETDEIQRLLDVSRNPGKEYHDFERKKAQLEADQKEASDEHELSQYYQGRADAHEISRDKSENLGIYGRNDDPEICEREDEIDENPAIRARMERPLSMEERRRRREEVSRAIEARKRMGDIGEHGKYYRHRIASPREFDSRSFRTIAPHGSERHKFVIGCPKKYYSPRTGKCKVGTEVQSVLTRANGRHKRGISANASLLVVRNPQEVYRGEFKSIYNLYQQKLGKVPRDISMAMDYVYKTGNRSLIKKFIQGFKRYCKFHNALPEKMNVINIKGMGNKDDIEIFAALGKAPAISYTIPSGMKSNKAGTIWVHTTGEHGGKKPTLASTADGKSTITLPDGTLKVREWLER